MGFVNSIFQKSISLSSQNIACSQRAYKPDISDISWFLIDTACISPHSPWSVNENSNEANISIFPNPFTVQTTISFSKEQTNNIVEIIDLLGNVVKIIHFAGNQLTLQKGGLKPGVYLVKVIEDEKNIICKKIVIL